MSYIDGFVIAVPEAKKQAYLDSASKFAVMVKEWGASRVVECWGDDVPDGTVTDFKKAVQAKNDEVVVFSWVEYPSKAVRDLANEKMRNDPNMKDWDMPFDGKRMIFGGFAPLLDR